MMPKVVAGALCSLVPVLFGDGGDSLLLQRALRQARAKKTEQIFSDRYMMPLLINCPVTYLRVINAHSCDYNRGGNEKRIARVSRLLQGSSQNAIILDRE
jgi:hypothetical protein